MSYASRYSTIWYIHHLIRHNPPHRFYAAQLEAAVAAARQAQQAVADARRREEARQREVEALRLGQQVRV